MRKVNELKFQGEVIRLVTQLLKENPELPFQKITQEDPDSRNKRKDLLLIDKNSRLVLSGELKLPDRIDGKSPYNEVVIRDAHGKADEKGISYFFTWNVNDFVLWKTFKKGTGLLDRNLKHYKVLDSPIIDSDQLSKEQILQKIKGFLLIFLRDYDEIFYKIKSLFSLLQMKSS